MPYRRKRFTVDGSDDLEQQIAQDLEEIRNLVLARLDENHLTALVLGGGYGRGEGGVYVVDGKETVYNDYDFFVIVPHAAPFRRRIVAEALSEVKSLVEPRCGIHVDFSPPIPHGALKRLPYELMFMELKAGHHVIIGPPDVLEDMPSYDVESPPLEEGARLFMNRGVGLLLARRKLQREDGLPNDDHEFVVRNIRKAKLAMGDAVLFVKTCYSPSYSDRLARFRQVDLTGVPEKDLLSRYYEEAMAFKFHPSHECPGATSLSAWHEEVTRFYETMFLWFEQQRLSDPNLDWAAYQRRGRRLPRAGLLGSLRNLVRNLQLETPHLPTFSQLFLHPRDRVLARLPNLLFSNVNDPAIVDDVLRLWKYCG